MSVMYGATEEKNVVRITNQFLPPTHSPTPLTMVSRHWSWSHLRILTTDPSVVGKHLMFANWIAHHTPRGYNTAIRTPYLQARPLFPSLGLNSYELSPAGPD